MGWLTNTGVGIRMEEPQGVSQWQTPWGQNQTLRIIITMTSLSVFSFNDNQVRIVTVDGEPWFVAKDVLEAMETSTKVTDLKALIVEDLGDEFVTNESIKDTLGRNQEMMLLSEPALTLFVSRSRTEVGKSMNRWIHTEVLPAIRKTGRYEVIPKPDPTPALPPADVRVDKLMSNLEKLGIDITNPRYHQCIQDFVMDKIMGAAGPALPASNEPQWLGVAEKAEQMGYSVGLVSRFRSALGRFVSSHVDEFNLELRREKRLCNGTQREINLFKDCPELEQVIAEYMDAKVLAS